MISGGSKCWFSVAITNMVLENYERIKVDVRQIVADELERIKNDPALAHLLQQK